MCADPSQLENCAERLRELLLEYLRVTRVSTWPGADGLTVEDVLTCYPEAIGAWEVPDWRRFVRENPELEAAVQAYLAHSWRPGLPP
jgi:hypothetical protein